MVLPNGGRVGRRLLQTSITPCNGGFFYGLNLKLGNRTDQKVIPHQMRNQVKKYYRTSKNWIGINIPSRLHFYSFPFGDAYRKTPRVWHLRLCSLFYLAQYKLLES